MDNFYEQLITAKGAASYKIANIAFYVLLVLAAVFMAMNIVISMFYIVLAAVTFFLKKQLYVEYEYVFTNGEIDMDKILEMKKRTKAISFSIKDIELMAPEGSDFIRDFKNKPAKVLSLHPKNTDKKIYIAMVTGGMKRVQLRFIPDEQFISLCYKYNPRAVKRA